jgi:hypothetical protein
LNSRAPRVVGWLALAALAAVLIAAGTWLLFTTFMVYDDEGYVLYSLRNYGEHGRLYDAVFSQYGPFFFAFYDAIHRVLGFAWTSTNGRLLTLVHWVLTAAFCGALTWRQTRSLAATAFVYVGVFTAIWIMIYEPSHPGGAIGCFVALAAWLGSRRDPGTHGGTAVALGALGAALALTKINVGAFMLFSGFGWLVLRQESKSWRTVGGAALTLWLLAMPWILMAKKLDEGAAMTFAAFNNLAVLGLMAVIMSQPAGERAGRRSLGAFLAGAAGLTLLTVAVTLLRGSTPFGILSGVLLDPLNQPNVYSFAVDWQPWAWPVNLGALAVAVWAARRPGDALAAKVVVGVRFLAAAGFVLAIVQVILVRGLAGFAMSYGVGLAGVCALPLRRDADGEQDARVRQWLALVLVLQSLHAYPVAGSQLNWATFLWVPLLALAVRDAFLALPAGTAERTARVALLGAAGAWAIAGYMTYRLADIGQAKRSLGEPLALPGAERIQPADDTAFGLRIMAENAKAHTDLLYSLPGLYSFNLWTGLPTPTLDNSTQWFLSLNETRQAAIRDTLKENPRAALIVQMDTLKFLVDHGFRVRGALGDYLGTEFQKAFEVDGYAFWVRRGRTVAPLSTGRAAPGQGSDRTKLELVLAGPKQPIARIELWQLGQITRVKLATLTAADATLAATPLDPAGNPSGPAVANAWATALPAPIVRLTAEYTGKLAQPGQVLATAFAADGTRLAAIRILGQ